MSQKVSRAGGAVTDEKEKCKTDSPVKDLKKKLTVIIEKDKTPTQEKQANGAGDKKTNSDKQESGDKGEKKQEKKDKNEKKETKEASGSKAEKSGKPEPTPTGSKQNGTTDQSNTTQQNNDVNNTKDSVINAKVTIANSKETIASGKETIANGKETIANGKETIANGKETLTNGSNGNESKLVSDEEEDLIDDELFPELRYDESDLDNDSGDVRSVTRRSQVKCTKTPETPRPASDTPQNTEQSKESKVLKLTDTVPAGERKLRSAESGTNGTEEVVEDGDKDIENGEARKPDTNFSKSRVKISPYRRSMRLADQTTSSTAANYTGNNTTMEMDITGSSLLDPTLEDSALHEDSYVQTIRSIRGRKSYKQLGEMNLSALSSKSARDKKLAEKAAQNACREGREGPSRPTSVVVGRKRRAEDTVEVGVEAMETNKRSRLFATLAHFAPFSRNRHSDQMIVGVNTDLPMSIPVPETTNFDPEALKTIPADTPLSQPSEVIATETKSESKKCIIM